MKVRIPKSHGKTRIGSIWLDMTDGGPLIISPTKDGGIVITHVPPREPVTGTVGLPASVMVEAGNLSAARVSKILRSTASVGKDVMQAVKMLREP
jgi:hypothetical protein